MPSRELLPAGAQRELRDEAGAAGLDYASTQVGSTGNITVCYANSLGTPGETLAKAMLGVVAGPYNDMESFFGIQGGSVSIVVAPLSTGHDGSSGAYHDGCDFNTGGTLYLDATFSLANAVDVELALYVAELSETFMGPQGKGWGCGYSNGEGLSRYCAEIDTPPGSFPSWGITGPSWVQAGYPDWVTKTEQTDQDYVSVGCAILYIYYMRSLGYTTQAVVQAGGATLAANYQTLCGAKTAYADLKAAVKALAPIGTDNPFQFIGPVVGRNGNGQLSAFLVGEDTALYRYDQAADGSWGPAQSMAGTWPPVATVLATNQSEQLSAFLIGEDAALYRYDQAANGSWGPAQSMAGEWPLPPVVARNGNGQLSAFLTGEDTALYRYDQAANGTWGPAASMAGQWPRQSIVAANKSGQLSAFLIGEDTALYRYDQAANGSWGPAQSMAGQWPRQPIIAVNPNGALCLFLVGEDTALYRYDEAGPNGAWNFSGSMGGTWPLVVPVVVPNQSGQLSAFVIGEDTALYRYDQAANGTWGPAQSMAGEWQQQPIVVANKSGQLSAFLVGEDTALYRYDQAANGTWGPAQSMAGQWG